MWSSHDPRRGDDPRSREPERPDLACGSRGASDTRGRTPVDPRDVFVAHVHLPRGDARERVRVRDRVYELRGSESRLLATVGAFHVVPASDLRDHRDRPADPRQGDLRELREAGLIETAHRGTVFLDEVGEMPLSTQAKLLRVLETRQVMRVGGLRPRDVDVRFVAATNQNLESDVQTGQFREDLYYRLNGISLVIPPLRERTAEIPQLAKLFISEAARDAGFDDFPVLSDEAESWMGSYDWPGNVRELRNAVNRAVILASAGLIQPEHLQPESYSPRTGRGSGRPPPSGAPASVEASASDEDRPPPGLSEADLAERQRIVEALAACGGNQTRAAKMLGIARRTLTSRLDKLGLPRPRKGR